MLHTHIAFLRKFYISGLLSTSFLLAIITLAFFPVTHSYSDAQAASVVSETTLSMTAQNVDLPLSVSNVNGTFGTSEPASFTVTTNNYSGYTLNIHAATNDDNYSKLINGQSVLNSISAAAADETGFNNGNWGFKPSMLNSDPNSNYLPAPTYAGTTIDETDGANPNNTANTYNIAIGAKVDYGQAAGKYSNTFVITAVANAVGYSVTYNENTEDTVTDMPANQSGNATAQSIEISSTTPSRSGYTFINWCDSTTTTTSGVDSCNGNVYQPGDSYDTDQTTTNNLVLKAMWQQQVVNGYTINFDANNGTGTMNPQVIPYGESANLTTNTFTRTNYIFDGWNTASDGNGTDYADEAPFTAPADDTGGSSITLYAKWATPVYDTIVFNGNGADGGSMANQQIMQGTSADLTANAYTKSGVEFNGWNTAANGLGEGIGNMANYVAEKTGTAKTVNLYAQWTTERVCVENCNSQDEDEKVYESGITIARAYELAYNEHHLGMYEETDDGNGIYERVDSWNPVDPESYKGFDTRYAMQDIYLTYNNVSVCDLVTVIGDDYSALDVRDNKLYHITKTADGECWMTQNLDFDPNENKGKKLKYSDTDLGWSSVPADTSAEYQLSTSTLPTWKFLDLGDVYYYAGTKYNSLEQCIAALNSKDKCMHYHAGNLYDSNEIAVNSAFQIVQYVEIPNSLCPAAWRLPRGLNHKNSGDPSEINNLFYTYGANSAIATTVNQTLSNTVSNTEKMESAPLYGNRPGYMYNGTVSEENVGNLYWTSTENGRVYGTSTIQAYSLESYGLYPTMGATSGMNGSGGSARCVAR